MRGRPGRAAVLAVVVGVLPLTGCSLLGGGGSDGSGSSSDSSASVEEPVDDLDSAAGEEATEVTGDLPVVATRAVTTDEGALEVDLNGVRVRDELMTVLFTVRVQEAPNTFYLVRMFDDNAEAGASVGLPRAFSTDGVYVLDAAEGTRHLAAYDSEDRCVCSSALNSVGRMETGGSLVLSTTFTAPPESTELVDVVIPAVEVFSGVKVER